MLALLPILAQVVPDLDQVDYTTAIQQFADQLTDLHASLLVPQGIRWNALFFFVMLALNIANQLYSRSPDLDAWSIGKLIFRWATLHLAITYWDIPVWNDVSVHQIISHQMTQIAALMDMTIVDEFNLTSKHVRQALQMPSALNFLGDLVYLIVNWGIGLMQGCTFLITSASYPILAVGYVVGPDALAFLELPPLAFIGNGYVRFLLIYSFARVAANGLVWIWCHALMWFFSNVFGVGDEMISLGTMIWYCPVIGMLVAGFALSMLQVYTIGRDIFHGTASVGSSLSLVGSTGTRMVAAAGLFA